MAINIKKNDKKKMCPFMASGCEQSGCMMYHEELARCIIDLLAFNVYSLSAEIKKLNKKQN